MPAGYAAAHHECGLPGEPVVVVRVAGEGNPDEEQAHAGRQQDGTEPIDLRRALDVLDLQRHLEQDECDDSQRHAHEERPAPAQRAVNDEAAQQRAAGSTHRHDSAHVTGVLAAVARRNHGADDRLCQGGEAAHGHALDDTGGQQQRNGFRKACHDRACDEDDDAQLDQELLVEEVRELAPPDGRGGSVCQQRGVMTQAKSVCVPLSSDMMVGSALATIVLLRIAVKKAARSPPVRLP